MALQVVQLAINWVWPFRANSELSVKYIYRNHYIHRLEHLLSLMKSIKFLVVLALFCCCFTNTFSQNLDSLEQVLTEVKGKDSVDILNNLGLNYAYSSLEKAKMYSDFALEKARELNYHKGEVAALINVGYSLLDHGKNDSAIALFEDAIHYALDYNDLFGAGNAYNALGSVHKSNADFASAIASYKEALFYQMQVANDRGISSAYNNLGKTLVSIGAYNEAMEYLLKALAINQKNGWDRKAALNLKAMALAKIDQQEEHLALEYLEQVRAMENLKDDLYIQTDLYTQLGFVYSNLKKYDESINALQTAIGLEEKWGNVSGVPHHNLADTYRKMGNYPLAEKTALLALSYKQEKNKTLSTSYTLNLLSDIYLATNQLPRALDVSLRALEIVRAKNAKSRERKTHMDLAEVYEAQRNFPLALRHQKLYQHLQDSLFNAQKAVQQTAMLTLFETEKKQQQIETQKAKIETQNLMAQQQQSRQYFMITGIVVLLIFLIVIAWAFINIRKVKKQVESQNQQLTSLNQTKDKFFGIIAHDLRSPLLGLQSVGDQMDYFLKKGDQNKLETLSSQIESTTGKLTDLLDNLLNWALLQNGMIPYDPNKVNLKEEVQLVVELLQALADTKEITLSNEINEDAFVYADHKAVNTILRNIISNALKFTSAGGKVIVSVAHDGHLSNIMINDTGTGISAEEIPKLFELRKDTAKGTMGEQGSGLGLVLCKELVELNRGTLKVISELGKGSCFSFKLPSFSGAMVSNV